MFRSSSSPKKPRLLLIIIFISLSSTLLLLLHISASFGLIIFNNYRIALVPHLPSTSLSEQHFYRTIHTVYGLWDDGASVPMKQLDTWKEMNPDWQLIVHDKDESDKLVGSPDFKWLEPLYQESTTIQKADLLRLLFVYTYGGIYTDVDVSCSKSVEVALCNAGFSSIRHSLVAFTEAAGWQGNGANWPLRNGVSEINVRIANYVFYAAPRSPALLTVIVNVAARLQRWQTMSAAQRSMDHGDKDYATLYVTGPDVFTEVVFGGPSLTPLDGVLVLDENVSKHFHNIQYGQWREHRVPLEKLNAFVK